MMSSMILIPCWSSSTGTETRATSRSLTSCSTAKAVSNHSHRTNGTIVGYKRSFLPQTIRPLTMTFHFERLVRADRDSHRCRIDALLHLAPLERCAADLVSHVGQRSSE